MKYEAWEFAITLLDSGKFVGMGLICVQARYASVFWFGADRLDRRRAEWSAVWDEIKLGLSPGPLPRQSPIHKALAAEHGGRVVIQYVSCIPVEVEELHQTAERLDRLLRSLVEAYRSTR